MIVTKQKNFDTILHAIDHDPVFIMGCNECATLCGTGGENQVLAIKKALEKQQIQVTGTMILEPACHLQNDKRLMKACSKEISKASKILMLACGNGVQTVAELLPDKKVISGTDTLFLGEIVHADEFQKRCSLCGDCLVDSFAGLCPVSRCPKSMLNGPCGGSSNGYCEVEKELPCVWDQVYQSLKKRGKLSMLRAIQPPKDWSKSTMMTRSL
ncbi:MAG TPA: methylenetetrahydrofolate reductase C-terminal domain-containing protein [Candidatus Thermoplasmatota archaeon]|nr:methylenetetrahydrofolate reductase C-terminal domain-containing protein [Candidatus Thermoplasmatota archaeon]